MRRQAVAQEQLMLGECELRAKNYADALETLNEARKEFLSLKEQYSPVGGYSRASDLYDSPVFPPSNSPQQPKEFAAVVCARIAETHLNMQSGNRAKAALLIREAHELWPNSGERFRAELARLERLLTSLNSAANSDSAEAPLSKK